LQPRFDLGFAEADRTAGEPDRRQLAAAGPAQHRLGRDEQPAQALDLSKAGLRMVEFPQHDSRLVPASERLSAAILERRLRHPGDPVLDRHVAAAVAKQTQRGARIAHAGGRHASNRIDAVIALAMAVDRAENQPEPARLIGWL
jgi:hypothetical protein